ARTQLWVPMRLDSSNFLEYWGGEFIPLIARLRAAAALPSAQSEVRDLMSRFRGTFPYPMARDFNADATASFSGSPSIRCGRDRRPDLCDGNCIGTRSRGRRHGSPCLEGRAHRSSEVAAG